jgi:hypothetical protein
MTVQHSLNKGEKALAPQKAITCNDQPSSILMSGCCRPKPPDGRRQTTPEPGGLEPLSVGLAARTCPEVRVRWVCHLTYT